MKRRFRFRLTYPGGVIWLDGGLDLERRIRDLIDDGAEMSDITIEAVWL